MITKTTILAFIFVTQTVCLTATALAAESNKDFGPLTKLTPPVTVTGGRITGEGKDRNAELVVKSDSSRSISAIVVQTLLLRSDGSVSRSIPHTLAGFSGHDGRNTLDRGRHRDHRAVSALTLDAWLIAPKSFALYYYEVAEDTMMFSPTGYVDISSVEARRRAACYAHASQQPDKWYPKQVEITRARGVESGFPQAEAFLRHPESKPALLP